MYLSYITLSFLSFSSHHIPSLNIQDLVTASFMFHELPQQASRDILAEMFRVTGASGQGIVAITDNNPKSTVIQQLPPAIFTLMKSTEPVKFYLPFTEHLPFVFSFVPPFITKIFLFPHTLCTISASHEIGRSIQLIILRVFTKWSDEYYCFDLEAAMAAVGFTDIKTLETDPRHRTVMGRKPKTILLSTI